MKIFKRWMVVPITLATVLSVAGVANAGTSETPLQSPVVVNGTSGGPQSSQCGYIAGSPNQVVRVTQPLTPIRFRVQGAGEPTLLINGPNGRSQCVLADSYSGGTIEVPGVWEPGTYSVYIGDRARGSHPFTLSITQE